MSRFKTFARDAFWVLVAIGIVGGGVVGFMTLGALKQPVAPAPVDRIIPFVETAELTRHAGPLPIRGEGFIKPFREIDLVAETSGRIVALHPAIETMGEFKRGEVLVRLDDRTAQAMLTRAESNIRSTRARLELNRTELNRGRTLLQRGVITQARMDELQSENNELIATLASLEADRESAQITFENTQVMAPFDGAVLSHTVELGGFVSIGEEIARLFTDTRLEVTVPLPETDAVLIPGLFAGNQAPATVTGRFAGHAIAWDAKVSRVDTSLDSRTRTLNVTVELVDGADGHMAAGDRALASGTPPALINAFVNVTISGAVSGDLYAVPSTSIREGGTIWTAEDRILSIRTADIVHVDGETTYVRLQQALDGVPLVTSVLDAPIDGMDVRVADIDPSVATLPE